MKTFFLFYQIAYFCRDKFFLEVAGGYILTRLDDYDICDDPSVAVDIQLIPNRDSGGFTLVNNYEFAFFINRDNLGLRLLAFLLRRLRGCLLAGLRAYDNRRKLN
jgi:hypothetical protein